MLGSPSAVARGSGRDVLSTAVSVWKGVAKENRQGPLASRLLSARGGWTVRMGKRPADTHNKLFLSLVSPLGGKTMKSIIRKLLHVAWDHTPWDHVPSPPSYPCPVLVTLSVNLGLEMKSVGGMNR